jgi:hypothetical protein
VRTHVMTLIQGNVLSFRDDYYTFNADDDTYR